MIYSIIYSQVGKTTICTLSSALPMHALVAVSVIIAVGHTLLDISPKICIVAFSVIDNRFTCTVQGDWYIRSS